MDHSFQPTLKVLFCFFTGKFGKVYRGWFKKESNIVIEVAVKTTKGLLSN